MVPEELKHRLARYALNPCGEIIGSNCNLAEIHLNQIDPHNLKNKGSFHSWGAVCSSPAQPQVY